eukprot:NODE_958_length_1072_cov_199.562072_g787_i0.p6 GENE.NODE_958_length_1072_cov_199.562072_g787_i0~~NODE_958_length_1072_cov_199.562072_g787_i0.p6  ORF type:complete len:78 (+),score=5.19 NODE_958_length_1072_cov_199.562072_g787_i0:67-300(+)
MSSDEEEDDLGQQSEDEHDPEAAPDLAEENAEVSAEADAGGSVSGTHTATVRPTQNFRPKLCPSEIRANARCEGGTG